MPSKTYYIIIEKEGVIGNPIRVSGTIENLKITDYNRNSLNVVGVIKDVEFAKMTAKEGSNRSIYEWHTGSEYAYYRKKY